MTDESAVQIAGLTDIGKIRKANEDSILIDQGIQLYAVADGMGGHGSGDVASQLALETLQRCMANESVANALSSEHITDEQALSLVFQCIAGVNTRIYQENVKNGQDDGEGMGTTLVGLCLYGNSKRAISFNIGDSRLYQHNKESLTQITTDHTMYQVWIEKGRRGPMPPPNLIVRAVGLFAEVDIDLEVIAIDQDSTYLLCSDGLSGMISDKAIAAEMRQTQPLPKLCENLVALANDKGGSDNISVIVLNS